MKYCLCFLLLALSWAARAQTVPIFLPPVDSTSGLIAHQAVVKVPDASQAELYRRAREWFASTFTGYKEVVSVEDPAGGEMAGTYHSVTDSYLLLTNYPYELWRTLHVYVKEGRYRYELTNFSVRDITYDRQRYLLNRASPRDMRRYGRVINQQATQDIASLTAAMSKPTGGTGNAMDW